MKNSNLFQGFTSNSARSKSKSYKRSRAKRTVERNSVLSLISDYIDKKTNTNNFKRTPFVDDGLYFQIFGMLILTVAVVISFQSFVNSDSLAINAAQAKPEQVRLLTNFQYQPGAETKQTRLQDFSTAPTTPVSLVTTENKAAVTAGLPKNEMIPATHDVTEGDSVYSIAADYGIKPQDIIDKNQLEDPYPIKVGQTLKIS